MVGDVGEIGEVEGLGQHKNAHLLLLSQAETP